MDMLSKSTNSVYTVTFYALLLLLTNTNVAGAEQFGRFFTTAKQRLQLDELKKATPQLVVDINDEDILVQDEEKETETVSLDAVKVKGFVYRSDGKNTAWINDSNTYEADLGMEYKKVTEKDITKNKITLELMQPESKIELKTGQTYDPLKNEVLDIIRQDETPPPAVLPRPR